MNRIGIFAFYDIDGIVDDYVIYLLEKMLPFFSRILCVVNGSIDEIGEKKLKKYCSELLIRPNEGYDTYAYKEGYDFIKDRYENIDEIIFFNDSIFGPFFPLDEMFSKMERKDIDFWGLSRYIGGDKNVWGLNNFDCVPEHIQTFFWAVRKKMIYSGDFDNYWRNLPEIANYKEAVSFHEMIFTDYFSKLGYKWDCFIEPGWYDGLCLYPLMSFPRILLEHYRCPFIKRKSFIDTPDLLNSSVKGGEGFALINYLSQETDYDVELISKNITRTTPVDKYFEALAPVFFICESKKRIENSEDISSNVSVVIENPEAFQIDMISKVADFKNAEIFIYCKNKSDEIAAIEKFPNAVVLNGDKSGFIDIINVFGDRLRTGEFLLYLNCTTADKQIKYNPSDIFSQTDVDYSNLEKDFSMFYNSLHSFKNVALCADFLLRRKEFGVLIPLNPTHDVFCIDIPMDAQEKERMQSMLSGIGIKLPLSEEQEQIRNIGGSFFCYTKILKPLFNDSLKKVEEEEYVIGVSLTEYLPPILAQNEGKFTAVSTTSEIVSGRLFTTNRLLKELTGEIGTADKFNSYSRILHRTKGTLEFYETFFNPKSFRDRIYMVLMALLSKKHFMRFRNMKKENKGVKYHYDIFGSTENDVAKDKTN
ncbi:MAG: hypothetical protein GX222_06735 [Ruminococcaceae bacterium]|nr:hypothetical protein [Oscillospiraceae bacterium]